MVGWRERERGLEGYGSGGVEREREREGWRGRVVVGWR